MSVDGVEITDDRSEIDVSVSFTNTSDQILSIHALDTGVRLSGRSVSGAGDRYDELLLAPGEGVTLHVTSRVNRLDAQYVDERLREDSNLVWNISGRVSVSVEDLGDDLWLPFRSNLDVQ